jgi:hypothetical protein
LEVTVSDLVKVLNLGAGVQSTTVLRLALRGEIERPNHVIFADTGWEPRAVYEHLAVLEEEMREAGIEFHKVSAGNIKDDALRATDRGTKAEGERYANMPYYTLDRENGGKGMIRRQCTREYKIDPISKLTRELCGVGRKNKNNCTPLVERWFGISLDEIQRMRQSAEWWAVNYYPLVELGMTRDDCLQWMERNGYTRPPRSACIACPYRSDAEWRHLSDTSLEEFEEACEFDDAIRTRGGMRGDIYVHRSCLPLRDVDLSTPEDHGQQNMWRDLECAGMCGV